MAFGVSYNSCSISYRGESQPLAGVHAMVATAGDIDRRVTATRLILTGPLAFGLRKKKDDRETFLLIEGEYYAWAVPVKPDQYAPAQQFAASINTSAKHAQDWERPAEQPPAPRRAPLPPARYDQMSVDELIAEPFPSDPVDPPSR